MKTFLTASLLLAISAESSAAEDQQQQHHQLRRELARGGKKGGGGDGGTDPEPSLSDPVSCDLTALPLLTTIPVKQSIVDFRTEFADGTEGGDPTDFPDPPCGKDFFEVGGVQVVSKHGCTYFPADGPSGRYECECKERKCQEFLDNALENKFFASEDDLCALEGFTLVARRQWFWQCECTDPAICGADLVAL